MPHCIMPVCVSRCQGLSVYTQCSAGVHWQRRQPACVPVLHAYQSYVCCLLLMLLFAAEGTPTYKGVPFMTSKGPVTSTIPNAHVA